MEQESIAAGMAAPVAGLGAPKRPALGKRARAALGNRRLRLGIQILVIAVVFFFVGRAVWDEWPQVQSYPWHVEVGYALLAMLLLLARGPIICMGWRLILRYLGYNLPWATALRVYFYSGLAKYMPGSMWYAVGRVLLAEQVGVPKMITSVSIAIETAMVTVAAIIVGALALTARPDTPWWPLAIVLGGLLAFLAWPRPWFALMNRGLTLIGRAPVTVDITGRQLLFLLPPFLLNWVAYGFISFFWTAALYPALPWSQWPAITGLYTAAWVIGFLTLLVPNGWGVREGLLTGFLVNLLGLSPVVALGAALLSRLGSILGEATWAAIAWRIKPPARV
jgi:glycosyltransferase 2 family protein